MQRAEKYVILFSEFAKDNNEQRFVRLVALQCVLDEKLKHLVEDPRIDDNIKEEIKRTAEEFEEVNCAVNNLLRKSHDNKKTAANLFAEYEQKLKEKDYINAKKIIIILKQRRRKALYELLIQKVNHDQVEKDFWLSRVGKFMGVCYTLTQIAIMIFLGVLVLFAFGTAPWLLGIVIPTMFIGAALTGVSNWWLFRGLTPKTLVALRNMLLIDRDVKLTSTQKNKLLALSFFCMVCGFMASYSFYILLIEMTPVALSLMNLTGLAVLAAGFPWVVPLIMIVFVLPIFINGALAVAAYFFSSLYEPIVRGKIKEDIYQFYSVMTEYDQAAIAGKLEELRNNARVHYGQYYKGNALEERIKEAVDESTLGIILIKKLDRLKKGKTIKWHSRLTLFFTVVFMFAMLCGIVVSQFLGRANLSSALSWAYGLAEFLSGLICVIAGLTYINVIISGGAKCIVDLAYGVEKAEGEEKTKFEKGKFQVVRAVNSSMNTFEAAAAFILKSVNSIKDFALAAGEIIKSGWDLSVGIFCTVSAGLASFLTNSIQGKPTTYEEDWEEASQKYKTAASSLEQWRKASLEINAKEAELKPLLLNSWEAKTQPEKQETWFSSIIPSFGWGTR